MIINLVKLFVDDMTQSKMTDKILWDLAVLEEQGSRQIWDFRLYPNLYYTYTWAEGIKIQNPQIKSGFVYW